MATLNGGQDPTNNEAKQDDAPQQVPPAEETKEEDEAPQGAEGAQDQPAAAKKKQKHRWAWDETTKGQEFPWPEGSTWGEVLGNWVGSPKFEPKKNKDDPDEWTKIWKDLNLKTDHGTEDFGIQKKFDFATFQQLLTLCKVRKVGIKHNPALALSILNIVAPAMFELPIRYLKEYHESDISGVMGMAAFIYAIGYVPVVGSGQYGRKFRWIPMSEKSAKEVCLFSVFEDFDGVFPGDDNLPDVQIPRDAFSIACEILVPLNVVLLSRLKHEVNLSQSYTNTASGQRPVKLREKMKDTWMKTIFADNGKSVWRNIRSNTNHGLINDEWCDKFFPPQGTRTANMEGGASPMKRPKYGPKDTTARLVHIYVLEAYEALFPHKKPAFSAPDSAIKGVTKRQMFRFLANPKLIDHYDTIVDPAQDVALLMPPLALTKGKSKNMNFWYGRNGEQQDSKDGRQDLAGVSSFPSQPHPHQRADPRFLFDFGAHMEALKQRPTTGDFAPRSAAAYHALGANGRYRDTNLPTGNRAIKMLDVEVTETFLQKYYEGPYGKMDIYTGLTPEERNAERERLVAAQQAAEEEPDQSVPEVPSYGSDDDF